MKYLFPSTNKTNICLLGNPLIPNSDIPICKSCESKMTFIYSLKTEKETLLIFQCNADPGMCDDWDPNSGGNAVLTYTDIEIQSCSGFLTTESTDSEENSVGQLEGNPEWIQSDETPNCDCGKLMSFTVEVKERAHKDFNFGGGGCSYLFTCNTCNKSKFLWQC